ncbi:MAG: site-specific DNA-methyltransferase, partial [Hyphomonadaceae bacterium]|nr:site-specific DNA-methyltransferase [Hyphomonadaceae bacterium]
MTEINFKGKEFVYNHHLTVPFRPLVPDAGRGIGPVALDGNLIVHGDNLHALKALLPQYAGKVDCVFIDPPYNTGNEGWCYNDNVNAPMIREWLAASPVGIEDGLRHDKWCVMMWPRLRLLHELLSEDGSFWMTLDDNEAHRGKLLLDEIFGEKNFIANVVWQKKYSPQNDAKWFSDNHDHILVYAKTRERWRPNLLPRSKEMDARYENPDNDPKGPWKLITLHAKSGKDRTLEYTFFNGVKWKPPHGTYPRFSAETLKQYELEGKIWFGKDGNSIPSVKNYLSEVKAGVTPLTIWEHSSVGHNHEAKTDIKNVLGANPFDTPKPVKLIERVLRIASNKNSVILDSFAGSGTTAHAVLEANRRDGGNRRFILVEMEEDIADAITAERVRRVINGYPFKGTQKTELLREKITWTRLKKA